MVAKISKILTNNPFDRFAAILRAREHAKKAAERHEEQTRMVNFAHG